MKQLTIKQAADYLGVSRQRADQIIRKWDLPVDYVSTDNNRKVKAVAQNDIDGWLNARTENRSKPKTPVGYLTTDEAADELRVSHQTVREYCRKGSLTHIKTENRLFVSSEAVDNFVKPRRGRRPKNHTHQSNDQETQS